MLLFCPSCGRRFDIPGHVEANVAHKCPSCGSEFGGERPSDEGPSKATGRLKFVSGGETDIAAVPVGRTGPTSVTRTTPLPGMQRPARRLDPAACEIGAELSRDGAGVLHEARDAASGEGVLVRRLLPEGGTVVDAERWATAATKLQGLSHPRLVTVLGVGLRDGAPHVVTQRVDGQTLAEVSAGRPLNMRQATKFAIQIVEALTAAHGSGTLHGDLKPSNIIIDPQGSVRVRDFGLAPRALEAGEPIDSPHVRGWLPFAPPEAVRDGPDAVTERSDSYGLGALLYFMLTGRPPFSAADAKALVVQALEGTPPSPGSVNPKVPPALDGLVMRSLEKDPAHRQANAQALALELRKIERESYRFFAVSRERPRRWLKALLLLSLLGGLGYGGYYFYTELRTRSAVASARGYAEEARKLRQEGDAAPGRVEEIVGLYRRAVEAAGGTAELPGLQIELAKLLLELDRPEDAAELLKGAAGSGVGEAAEALALLPPALARAGEVEAATTALRRLGRADTAGKVVLHSGLEAGRVLLAGGHPSGAREIFEYLSEVATQAGEQALGVKVALGEAYAALGEEGRARDRFCEALKAEGDDDARALAALGLVRLFDPLDLESELAVQEEEGISASPMAQLIYVRLLVARGMQGRAARIVGEVSQAASPGPAVRAWAELARGEVLEAQGDLEKARSHFVEAERVSRKDDGLAEVAALAEVGLARLRLRSDRAAAALSGFRQCVERYSGKPEAASAVAWALVGQGDALRLMGKPDRAAQQYREATGTAHGAQREPHLAALCGLGEVAMETRDRARMRSEFKELASRPDARFYGMIAGAMAGEFTAGELLQAAARQRRDLASRAHYCVALKRDLAGDAEGAREMLKRTVDAAAGLSWYGTAAEGRLKR